VSSCSWQNLAKIPAPRCKRGAVGGKGLIFYLIKNFFFTFIQFFLFHKVFALEGLIILSEIKKQKARGGFCKSNLLRVQKIQD
jgi:predicted lipid-binding transport protein (Tim44 family)